MKKIVISVMALMCILLGSMIGVNAESELEQLYILGSPVHYLNKSNTVYVPKTYKEDVHEMRGVWVATVWNNDFERQKGVSENAINDWKAEYLSVLDTAERYNMNTIFFQVRPTNDAFYPSIYNDWSKFMAGAGVNPGWDPLEWMVEQTHARGMYFQCWLNAYRVTEGTVLGDSKKLACDFSTEELLQAKKSAINSLAENNFAKKHPEYVLLGEYDTKLILNPGEPAVREHIVNSIKELVTNYDIDGFHFDDYFYLNSKSSGTYSSQTHNLNFAGGVEYDEALTGANTLNDLGTYRRYLANPSDFEMEAGLNLGDFRRESINLMMKNIRDFVDEYNAEHGTYVEFGSKPAAVWQSSSEYCNDSSTHPEGSNTACGAYSSNYNLFADTKHWVEEGYVDWVAPQVYYDFANREAPYADIVEWWSELVDKVNTQRANNNQKAIRLYIAHGIYHAKDESTTRFKDYNEMVYQLKFNTKFDNISGSAVYAYSDLLNFRTETQRYVIGVNFYNLWNKNRVVPLPRGEYDASGLKVGDVNYIASSNGLVFKARFEKNEDASMYILYRVEKGQTVDPNNTDHRYTIVKNSSSTNDYVTIQVGGYSENYDYYLQAVSNNFHLSDQIEKLDVDMSKVNTAPVVNNIVVNDNKTELPAGDKMTIVFDEAVDEQNDEVTYSIDISIDGKEGPYRFNISNYQIANGKVSAVWNGLNYPDKEVVVKITVKDGEFTNTYYSQTIILTAEVEKEQLNMPSINSVDLSTLQINFNEVSNAEAYKLHIYDNAGTLLQTVDAQNNSAINYSFEPGTEYHLKLQAVSTSGDYIDSELSYEYIVVINNVVEEPSVQPSGCSFGSYTYYLIAGLAAALFVIKFKK